MDPNQQQPQDFSYLYEQQPVGKTSDPNRMKRIIIGGSLLLAFVLIVIVVVVILLSGPDYRVRLGKVAAQQQEIIRVAELGLDNDRLSQTSRNFAADAVSLGGSNLYAITVLVDDNYGQPLTKTTLGSAEDSDVDAALSDAEARNDFDSEFLDIMETLLSDTNRTIESLRSEIGDKAAEIILDSMIENNAALLDAI